MRAPSAQALVGVQDARLQLFELVGRVALAGGDRLLAPVVGRNRRQLAARDLDVVAEDLGEPDLERCDTGAHALPLLELEDHVLAVFRELAQFGHARVVGRAEDPALARAQRRLVDERGAQQGL